MHNFDEARDVRMQGERSFQIGGQQFTYKPAVSPESLIPWADMTADTPEVEAIRIIDETVLAFLDPGQEGKWLLARDPDSANPLTADDIIELIKWLVTEQSGRPTSPPSDSSNGSETGGHGTNLKAVPVSPVAVA